MGRLVCQATILTIYVASRPAAAMRRCFTLPVPAGARAAASGLTRDSRKVTTDVGSFFTRATFL